VLGFTQGFLQRKHREDLECFTWSALLGELVLGKLSSSSRSRADLFVFMLACCGAYSVAR